jgi:hypothetical protein
VQYVTTGNLKDYYVSKWNGFKTEQTTLIKERDAARSVYKVFRTGEPGTTANSDLDKFAAGIL